MNPSNPISKLEAHPIAERYPLLTGEEFEEFKQSIKGDGQRVRIVLFEGKILDGRNRYRACLELGVLPLTEAFTGTEREAEVYADALNLHRRHLTREQKRAVIQYKLKANPERSDRAIAEEVRVDHKTVAVVRRRSESVGEIPQLEARKGKEGKSYAAKRPQVKPASKPAPRAGTHQSDAKDLVRRIEWAIGDAKRVARRPLREAGEADAELIAILTTIQNWAANMLSSLKSEDSLSH